MLVLRCDRCGKTYEIPWKKNGHKIDDIHGIRVIHKTPTDNEITLRNFDICFECAEALKEWMNVKGEGAKKND